MSIKVEATKKGYFGYTLHDVGSVFEIPDESCLGSWMKIIPDPEQTPKKEESFDDDFLN
jgi:hypothetical protein